MNIEPIPMKINVFLDYQNSTYFKTVIVLNSEKGFIRISVLGVHEPRFAIHVLITTSHFSKHLSDLFYTSRGPAAVSVSGSVAGMEGSHALRRASSIRRAFTSSGHAGIKRNSVALQVRTLS